MNINLTQFPFFYKSILGTQSLKDLCEEERKTILYEQIYNACKEYVSNPQLISLRNTSPKLNDAFTMYYNDCGGFIGHGIYYHKSLWKEYHWLFGCIHWGKRWGEPYAIRFPISISLEQVKHKGMIILLRHCKRFIKLYETQKL